MAKFEAEQFINSVFSILNVNSKRRRNKTSNIGLTTCGTPFQQIDVKACSSVHASGMRGLNRREGWWKCGSTNRCLPSASDWMCTKGIRM